MNAAPPSPPAFVAPRETGFEPVFDVHLDADLKRGVDIGIALRGVAAQPVNLRLHAIRSVMYCVTAVHVRPGPLRDSCTAGLERAIHGIEVLARLYADPTRFDGLHPVVQDCVARSALRCPGLPRAIETHLTEVRAFTALDPVDPAAQDALERIIAFSNGPLIVAIVDLLDQTKAVIAETRDEVERLVRDAEERALMARSRIEEIVRTVQLISLNARVEAARAGEHGRAFGVIAHEIRELSGQAEAASVEIADAVTAITGRIFGRE